MAYLTIDIQLPEHPKLFHLAELMGWRPEVALARLIYLWSWAMRYQCDGDLSRLRAGMVAQAMRVEVSESEKLLSALTTAGWIDVEPYLRLHDWWDHCRGYLKVKYMRTPQKWAAIRDRYVVGAGGAGGDADTTAVGDADCTAACDAGGDAEHHADAHAGSTYLNLKHKHKHKHNTPKPPLAVGEGWEAFRVRLWKVFGMGARAGSKDMGLMRAWGRFVGEGEGVRPELWEELALVEYGYSGAPEVERAQKRVFYAKRTSPASLLNNWDSDLAALRRQREAVGAASGGDPRGVSGYEGDEDPRLSGLLG